MNSIKRISALLLAALMAISLVPASAFARVEVPTRDAETIVGWNFDTDAVATAANANNTGAAVSRDNGVACNFNSNGVTGKSISSNTWNGASAEAPKYYTATVNAAGYEGIAVSASVRASKTGPKNVLMYYSINGTDFIAVEGASTALATDSTWGQLSGTLPAECDGAESIELRIAVIDTVNVGGSFTEVQS
ncbi:MAG: hypothetical protein II756_06565, partial [Clostridia bacterium]|nr:hypothetical protein [Clostridia bacterium]